MPAQVLPTHAQLLPMQAQVLPTHAQVLRTHAQLLSRRGAIARLASVGQATLAALPPHSAVRLCLTGSPHFLRLRLNEAQPQKKRSHRKGIAFPHCAAAKPLSLIE
jgi:hypothetical protein